MPGGGTDNTKYALLDPTTKQPVSNGARNVWVTETALTTALNTSYMASQLALFGIVVGVALLLSGFGFAILAIGGALRNPESSLSLGSASAAPKAARDVRFRRRNTQCSDDRDEGAARRRPLSSLLGVQIARR